MKINFSINLETSDAETTMLVNEISKASKDHANNRRTWDVSFEKMEHMISILERIESQQAKQQKKD